MTRRNDWDFRCSNCANGSDYEGPCLCGGDYRQTSKRNTQLNWIKWQRRLKEERDKE